MTNPPSGPNWDAEAAFFDEKMAVAGAVEPVPERTLARYGSTHHRATVPKDFQFRLLGDLKGKRVLDVGCGEGENSVLFGLLGAEVVGIDLSPGSIERARDRAVVNGVQDRVRFECAPIEEANLAPGSFDVVWGQAFLHHVLHDIPGVVTSLMKATQPDGMLLFCEPLNQAQWLRKLRLALPVTVEGTPDERPLENHDLELVKNLMGSFHLKVFRLTGRVDRWVLDRGNYEYSAVWRRTAFDFLATLDALLLRLPFFRTLGSIGVIWGKPHPKVVERAKEP